MSICVTVCAPLYVCLCVTVCASIFFQIAEKAIKQLHVFRSVESVKTYLTCFENCGKHFFFGRVGQNNANLGRVAQTMVGFLLSRTHFSFG